MFPLSVGITGFQHYQSCDEHYIFPLLTCSRGEMEPYLLPNVLLPLLPL